MPPAVRVGDPTNHTGVVAGPGNPTVLIQGMPAAKATDMHTCPWHPVPVNPFPVGSPTVLIGGLPALRMGDLCACGGSALIGAPTVLIG